MTPRTFLAALAALFTLAAGAAFAQGPARDYALLNPPQPTEGGGQIEVIEFFWYGCGHCRNLEPFIQKWEASLPKDVVFKRVPAVPSEPWAESARMYYTLEAMGQLTALHPKIFEAIHGSNVNMNVKKTRDDWLAKNGVDVAKYAEVEKSFSVVSKLNRAKQMTAQYKVDGVPMLFVNGKYITSNTHTKGNIQRVMPVVDELIQLSRAEAKRASAAPLVTPAPKVEVAKK